MVEQSRFFATIYDVRRDNFKFLNYFRVFFLTNYLNCLKKVFKNTAEEMIAVTIV